MAVFQKVAGQRENGQLRGCTLSSNHAFRLVRIGKAAAGPKAAQLTDMVNLTRAKEAAKALSRQHVEVEGD
jgi:hypothetical protein